MNCKEIRELFEEYIFGELSDEMGMQIKTHMDSCADCKREYEGIKESIEGIRDAYESMDVPDELSKLTVVKSSKLPKWLSYKKLTAVAACIITVLIAAMATINFLPGHQVSAGDYRGGYSLIPQKYDSTGISPGSRFTLKSIKKIDLKEIERIFIIDGEPTPSITRQDSHTFIITPSREFEQNRLYTFRIKGGKDISKDIIWTFQTRAVFKIAGAFPGDRTTEVPSNTGIEIYFSHEDFEDINKYFEITPSVKGKFERHKNTAVFVPEELKEGTLYTVKIKRGLKLKGTIYSLSQDYVFQFETGGKEESIYAKGSISYNKLLNEYSPDEKPYIPINYYVNHEKYIGSMKVSTTVYAYKNLNSFISDIGKKVSVPDWAYRSYSKNTIPVGSLDKAAQFEQTLSSTSEGDLFIKIPGTLPEGFYLVDSKWEDISFQTFIEVTDIGMYLMKGTNKTILWLNDISTGKPITDAVVSFIGENDSYYPDNEGVVSFDSIGNENSLESENSKAPPLYMKVVTGDGKTAVLSYGSGLSGMRYDYYVANSGEYWNLLQLDRSLYKPDDTVNFWGLVKDRYSDEKIEGLTVELGQGNRYGRLERVRMDYKESKSLRYYPIYDQPLSSQSITTENGVFKGSIKLPMLDPGGYQLTIKKGKRVIANSYINVENYTKPPYKIEIDKDREAIFPGQQVNFNLKASFFEGTGVPDLSVGYDISSGNIGENPIQGSSKTDSQGNIQVSYIPKPGSSIQGEQYVGINCHATLPEIGETSQGSAIRVFVNDVNVKLDASSKGNKAIINAEVNRIILDRINNGTAKDDGDYLGEAVHGKEIHVIVYKNTWVRIEDGQYYDFINKVTQKRYRYEPRREVFKTFDMKTGSDGKASSEFEAPQLESVYYSADVECADNSGRNMKFEAYVDNGYDRYNHDDNRYYLDGGKEKYNDNEKVSLVFKKGRNKMPQGRYLFIKTQNGIREHAVKNGPEYSFAFGRKDIPNVCVTGVYFNGFTYVESEQFNAVYNYKEKNLLIEAKTDKASYKPGDEVILDISARDKDGNPKKAVVNVSLVDEALFKLNEQHIDTLMTLYNGVPSGVDFSYESHVNSGVEIVRQRGAKLEGSADFGGYKANIKAGSAIWSESRVSVTFDEKALKAKGMKATTAFTTDQTGIRQDFRDAAYFMNVTLDDSGHGTLKFKLPDNITSWRVTLSGVTTDLSAGSGKTALNVSLPFFINHTINSTYLAGDKPVLGVNAYGSDLKKGDDVIFEVSSLTNPERVVKSKGKAFERIDIPLWEMKEGTEDIIIKASSTNGLEDSIKQTIKTVKSYHQIERAEYYDLKPGMRIEGGDGGNTNLIFSDNGKGAFLPELTELMYTAGNRVDQKLTAKIASELIYKYFKQTGDNDNGLSAKATDYQREDGGIALLPYGNSDADISARLATLIKDSVNAQRLKEYFYGILYDDSPGLKGNALYGLAVLREPVMLELGKAADVENADVKDLLYIALAYCELGDLPKAASIYNERILAKIEEYKPFYRINTGKDNDDVISCTSLAAVLASKLDKSHKEGFYEYCKRNSAKDILINVERLLYIGSEIEKSKDEKAKFSYSYNGRKETKVLENGESYSVVVPSKNMGSFKIEGVEGAVSLVSIFSTGIEGLKKPDDSLKIEREYSQNGVNANKFKQGEIIRIEIKWDMGPKAIDGDYEISDYLPSGLKAIENPYSMGMNNEDINMPFRRIDGQKVTFYVNKGWEIKKPLVYYARIVSPGSYKAEAPLIQGVASREAVNTGEQAFITID